MEYQNISFGSSSFLWQKKAISGKRNLDVLADLIHKMIDKGILLKLEDCAKQIKKALTLYKKCSGLSAAEKVVIKLHNMHSEIAKRDGIH